MTISRTCCHRVSTVLSTIALVLVSSPLLFAQSPWERAASNLEMAFTGPIARSLALVAIVIGGLTFMFGKRAPNARSAASCLGVGWRSFPASSCSGCSDEVWRWTATATRIASTKRCIVP